MKKFIDERIDLLNMKIKLSRALPDVDIEVEIKEGGYIGKIINKEIEEGNIVYIIEGKEGTPYSESDFIVLDYGLYEIKYFNTDTDKGLFFTKEESEPLLLKFEDAESLLFEDGFEKVNDGIINSDFTYYINEDGHLATLLFKKVKWR